MSAEPLPTRRADLLERPLDEELALFDVGRGTVHTLNPSATVVWHALGEASGRAELVEALLEAFDVSREEAERGVEEALAMFVEARLVMKP